MGQEQSSSPPAQQHLPSSSKAQQHPPAKRRGLEDVCYFDRKAQMLGQGSFGKVFKGYLRKDNKSVAVKIIEKANMQKKKVSFSMVATECELMRECAGKDRFVQLYDGVETNTNFALILEFCDGGNVQDGAMSVEGTLGETQVRVLMRQIVESIAYLHSKSICHRDVKPQNFFLMGNIARASVRVKLGDFGAAVRLPKGKLLKEQVGTPALMAPEVHLLPNRSFGYDHKVDVWAIGVCMIFLLANEYPFIDGQGRLLRERIIRGGSPLWEKNSFDNLFQGFQEAVGMIKKRPSRAARNLTRHLLAPCPQDRLNASAALQYEWFTRPQLEAVPEIDSDNLPLLDMKDFEEGLSKIERGLGKLVADALIIGNEVHKAAASTDHRQRSLSDITNQSNHYSPPMYEKARLAAMPRDRDDSKLRNCNPHAPPMSRPSQPHLVARATDSLGNAHACCLCRRDGSMLDHVCPCCNSLVCSDCICHRLPRHNLRCPTCGDTSRNTESMSLILDVQQATTSIGNVMSSIFGTLGNAHHSTQPQKGILPMSQFPGDRLHPPSIADQIRSQRIRAVSL